MYVPVQVKSSTFLKSSVQVWNYSLFMYLSLSTAPQNEPDFLYMLVMNMFVYVSIHQEHHILYIPVQVRRFTFCQYHELPIRYMSEAPYYVYTCICPHQELHILYVPVHVKSSAFLMNLCQKLHILYIQELQIMFVPVKVSSSTFCIYLVLYTCASQELHILYISPCQELHILYVSVQVRFTFNMYLSKSKAPHSECKCQS